MVIYILYERYFPYDKQNGTCTCKRIKKDKELSKGWFGFGLWCLMPLSTIFQLYQGGEYNFLIICRYLNLVKNQRLIL